MKSLILSILLIGISLSLSAQSFQESGPLWPNHGFSAHLGTNGIIFPLGSVNAELYHHSKRGGVHFGIGGGGFLGGAAFQNVEEGPIHGGHLMASFWSGKDKHHFEVRAGVLFVGNYEVNVLPLLQLGYRFQKPYHPNFWFVDLGMAGLGFGIGTAIP